MASDDPIIRRRYTRSNLRLPVDAGASTDPNREKLMMKIKVRGPCTPLDSRPKTVVDMEIWVPVFGPRAPKVPPPARMQSDVLDILNVQRIYDFEPDFYRMLGRYRSKDLSPFQNDDPDAVWFLCNWMADNFDSDEDGEIETDIKIFMQAALIAERFHCPRFWHFHKAAIGKYVRQASEELRFIIPPRMTLKIDRYTVEDSPIRRAAMDVLVWRRDLSTVSDFESWCDELLVREQAGDRAKRGVKRNDKFATLASEEFHRLLQWGFHNKNTLGDAVNPFQFIKDEQALDYYNYREAFEHESFLDPMVSAAEAEMISHQSLVHLYQG